MDLTTALRPQASVQSNLLGSPNTRLSTEHQLPQVLAGQQRRYNTQGYPSSQCLCHHLEVSARVE